MMKLANIMMNTKKKDHTYLPLFGRKRAQAEQPRSNGVIDDENVEQ